MESNQEAITQAQAKNVISLFSAAANSKRSEAVKENEQPSNEANESLNFAEIMRRNAENKKRLSDERKRANKGVIKSYRLKK